jgi:glucosamine--fructose-6-phosphate aminotransferase (isomerizing)
VVVARRGSPLLIGVKTEKKLKVDFVDVEFGGNPEADGEAGESSRARALGARTDGRAWAHTLRACKGLSIPQPGLLAPPGGLPDGPGGLQVPNANNKLIRSQSRAFLSEDGLPQPIEYFIASDASAIIEHTKRVLYLEDDDIAHIAEGGKWLCARARTACPHTH